MTRRGEISVKPETSFAKFRFRLEPDRTVTG
jgi:hypothetical protein